ncbi:hypothetical protein LWX53_03360 [bacterium]|nr:hypothetical protein [bacterium]
MIFLSTSETLARLGGAFPPGHRLLGLAAELAAGTLAAADGGGGGVAREAAATAALAERLFSRKGNAAAAIAEFGALGGIGGAARLPSAPAVTLLLWFDPCPERSPRAAVGPAAPSPESGAGCRQLVLDLPAGRYRAEYWDVAERRLAGVEIATAAPLVLGLPDPRAAYAVLIVSLF